jgi:hypothetical protein
VVPTGQKLKAIRVRRSRSTAEPAKPTNRPLTLYGTIKWDCSEQSAKIRLSNKIAGRPLRTSSNDRELSDDRGELAYPALCPGHRREKLPR